MKITVQNTSAIPNKYIRRLKYHLYGISEKFQHVIYAVIHVNKEGQSNPIYEFAVRIGISGPDVMIKNRSTNLEQLVQMTYKDAYRYCQSTKPNLRP